MTDELLHENVNQLAEVLSAFPNHAKKVQWGKKAERLLKQLLRSIESNISCHLNTFYLCGIPAPYNLDGGIFF